VLLLRVRRLPGGRHLFYGLGHGQLWVLVLVLAVVVLFVVLSNRRR
jgi:hypothetical protein